MAGPKGDTKVEMSWGIHCPRARLSKCFCWRLGPINCLSCFCLSPSLSFALQSFISAQLIADYANQLEIDDNTLDAYDLPFVSAWCFFVSSKCISEEDDPKSH